MAKAYSISRLSCFEQCRLQYKFRYIDKVPSEVESIEAFMGSRVHESLQQFYDLVKIGTVKPVEWLEGKYEELWQKNVHDSLKVVKEERSLDDYCRMGQKCLDDYYRSYQPFDQAKVVRTEGFIEFPVRSGDRVVRFCGVLDRLDWNDRDGIFEIHDYKSSGSLPSQEDADRDPQLGLYHLAVKHQWPEAAEVKLVWHYLVFNKEIVSRRTAEELEALQNDILRRVQEVETASEFSPNKSSLCEWCGYQPLCPLWKHPLAAAALPVNEYLKDPGVVLVRKYAELEEKMSRLKAQILDLEQEQARVEEAALVLAERDGLRVIDGPEHELVVTIKDEWAAPLRRENAPEWEGLRNLLLQDDKYIDVTTVNSQMLNKMLREWPQEFRDKARRFLIKRSIRKAELRPKK